MEDSFNRRKFLGYSAVSGLSLIIGCGEKRGIEQPNQLILGEPYYKVDEEIARSKYTDIKRAGPYLVGMIFGQLNQDSELYFKFRHSDDSFDQNRSKEFKPFIRYDNAKEELLPQTREKEWILPLLNLASHGNGPFTIYEIGVRDKKTLEPVTKVEETDIKIEIPHTMRGWEQAPTYQRKLPVRLPENTADQKSKEGTLELHTYCDLLIKYVEKPIVVEKEGRITRYEPECLAPIWLYNQGTERNTKIITRFHRMNVHGKVLETNPHLFTRRVIIDEAAAGGKAWHDQYRVSINGISSGSPCCTPTKTQSDEHGFARLDTHEQTHVLDLNQRLMQKMSQDCIRQFKAECWETLHGLDIDTKTTIYPKMIEPRTADDFVTSYAMTDDLEDLADTVSHAFSDGDEVRKHIIGKDRLTRKVDYVKYGFLKGKDWTCSEIDELIQ